MENLTVGPAAFLATVAVTRGEWEELAIAALVAVLSTVLQWLTRRKP